jgi:Tfp pilus assembly protein PilE
MGFLIPAVMGWFRTNPRNIVLILGLLAVIAVLAFTYARGRSDAAEKIEAARAQAVEKAKALNAVAIQKAAAEREADVATTILQEEVLRDAYVATPDQAPDAVRVALMCKRLLNTKAARLPEYAAACGPRR